jgi:hypothetical protein
MGAAFCAALIIAIVVLAMFGGSDRGTRRALEVTARFSFLLFWLAYAGGAMATVFGPLFRPLARRGRDFGLAFASAHLVHVGLVLWLYRISQSSPVSLPFAIFFSVGLVWVYLLALFSIKRLSQMLAPAWWRLLRTIGLEYISLAFLADFGPGALHASVRGLVGYLPFLSLGIVGASLRLLAWSRRRRLLFAPQQA